MRSIHILKKIIPHWGKAPVSPHTLSVFALPRKANPSQMAFCSTQPLEKGLSEAKTKPPSSRSRGRGAYGG